MEESSKKNKMNNLSNKANLKMFEEIIKYNFNDKSLLTKSLTHTSASTEKVSSMERLEFLGDRILGLVISEELFLKYPGLKEGELSKKYSFLVQRSTCAKVAENIGLNKFIILGKSELKNSQIKSSILSNIMEALIGSIFLDSDYCNTRKIVLNLWKEMISSVEKANNLSNSKSDLQEKILSMNKKLPNYKLISIQ